MKRYAETFFRYWYIILLPIIALPSVTFALVRHSGGAGTIQVITNLWATQPGTDAWNSYQSPAQRLSSAIDQLRHSSTFDGQVVGSSPQYQALVSRQPNPGQFEVGDLSQNLLIYPSGENLLSIVYTTQNTSEGRAAGVSLVDGLVTVMQGRDQQFSVQQAASNLSEARKQLDYASSQLDKSQHALSQYMQKYDITSEMLGQRAVSDPNLAILQSEQQTAVQNKITAQQRYDQLRAQGTSGPAASSFSIQDPPLFYNPSSGLRKQLTDTLFALVAGLLLGLGFLVARTALDRSMRYADEVPALLGLPVLAVLPYSPNSLTRTRAQPARLTAPSLSNGDGRKRSG